MRKTKTISNYDMVYHSATMLELISLKKEVRLMRKLSTLHGFYSYYLQHLKLFIDPEKTFFYVNNLYHSSYGEFKFKSYSDFKKIVQSKVLSKWIA